MACAGHTLRGFFVTGVFVILFLAAVVGIFKPYIRGAKRWQFAVAAFVAFILIGVAAPKSQVKPSAAKGSTETTSEVTTDKAETAQVDTEPASAWSYSTDKDEMRGSETKYAQLDGTNTINLDFPYGEQRGKILVRQSAQFGFDILFGVESGQILCHSYQNSYISVKFDNGPIKRYGCTDASDGTSNMVFLKDPKGFLSKLKASKKAIIEAEFFQNGVQQLTFDTAGLQWK